METIREMHAKELRLGCHKFKHSVKKSIDVLIKMLVASDNIQILHYTEMALYHVLLFDSECVEVALEL
jgi:hypothetical protein